MGNGENITSEFKTLLWIQIFTIVLVAIVFAILYGNYLLHSEKIAWCEDRILMWENQRDTAYHTNLMEKMR